VARVNGPSGREIFGSVDEITSKTELSFYVRMAMKYVSRASRGRRLKPVLSCLRTFRLLLFPFEPFPSLELIGVSSVPRRSYEAFSAVAYSSKLYDE